MRYPISKTFTKRHNLYYFLFLCSLLFLHPCLSQAATKTEAPQTTNTSQRFITIDFDNVDIRLFIKYISELTGKNFIIDKTVRGNVSIISPTKISDEEAYRVFESVLSVHGFTTIQAGSMIKIMPMVRARTENIDTLHHGQTSFPEDKIVTQLIPLTHTTPTEMKKVLAPLVSKTSVVIAHTQSGILIVTDTLSNIQKLLAIIESLDVDHSSDEMEVIPLEYATATTLATTINAIFKRAAAPKKGSSSVSNIKVVPYDRINAIIALAGPGDILRVKRLITMLDGEPQKDDGNIQVIYLQHARAKELAAVLSALPSQQKSGKGVQKTPSISKNVKIMPDEETNALIITASRSEFKVLDNVIKKLDIPRRMVYLEALIMEVDMDVNLDVGVKWLAGGSFSDDTGAVLTAWNPSDKTFSLTDVIPENATVGSGFSLGLLKQGIEIGGITFPNIGAILKAYQTDENINIIATPQILTTDNKKAVINVGENIPYITSQNTTNSEQDYTQYEYKDVSTKLSITPQINQADTLRLEILTEVVKLKGNQSSEERFRPTTYKRTAETTVIVKDNDTIVIGGIIGHDATEAEWKIPLLGDIPFLGWLFKTHTTSHRKTNMFIFITPRIVKNPADMARITLNKEDQLDEVMPQVKKELHRQVNLDHAMSLSDIGFQKMQNKNYGEAKNYFQEALEINPKSPYALMNLGTICEREGQPAEAIGYYQQVIDNAVDNDGGVTEVSGPTGMSLQKMCRENIERLTPKLDRWPYPENSDL